MTRRDPHAVPGGIVGIPRELSEEEWCRFERRWRWAMKADGNTLYLLNEDGTRTRLGAKPTWRQRIRRAYYRMRRWLA
jgi:hypothetical protein